MIRVDEETGLGVAVSTDCNGRFAMLDPYAGAQLALAESYRNVATGGATAAGDLRLPQLRLARGPGRDVAVRRGLPRAQGRLRRARHPGHRRQRQPLQPDRRDRDPADAGGRGARRDRRRHAAYADRVRRRRRDGAAARRDPRGAVRLGVGARRAQAPRRPAAGGRPGRARRRWPSCSARRSGLVDQRARPLRRRPRPGAGRVGAAQRRRRARCLARRRPVRRAVLRVGRAGARHRARRRTSSG